MNRIEQLMESYGRFIAVPWRDDAAPPQRVIFCVYNESDELKLRARVDEFEIATKQAGHEWALFDITDTFAEWFSGQRYKERYFEKPHLLYATMPKYLECIAGGFKAFLEDKKADDRYVVAIQGVGSLFGLLKVKDVVDKLAPLVTGRLLVFFPGTFENNNYRLLDAYDGWNYLAVPITADRQF